jgi:hypothetical protein
MMKDTPQGQTQHDPLDELVARLRALIIIDEVGSNNQLANEAADTIEALHRDEDEMRQVAINYLHANEELHKQLAAEQAREQQLRKALQAMVNYARNEEKGLRIADDALSLPQDITALNAWGAKLLRKWIAHIMANGCTSAVTNMTIEADELEKK